MSTRTARGGFTLIEVMAAMGIFFLVMVAFLQILMSVHRTNNAMSASITANAAIRSQADESLAVAAANALSFDGDYARAFVDHYSVIAATGETLAVGESGKPLPRAEIQGGVLTYRFPVPEPGSPVSAQGGAGVPYTRGLGEMRIYLDETAMPDLYGEFGDDTPDFDSGRSDIVWETGGDNSGDPGDGVPEDNRADPYRVFADITVTYYEDAAHTRTLTVNERRIIVTGADTAVEEVFG